MNQIINSNSDSKFSSTLFVSIAKNLEFFKSKKLNTNIKNSDISSTKKRKLNESDLSRDQESSKNTSVISLKKNDINLSKNTSIESFHENPHEDKNLYVSSF